MAMRDVQLRREVEDLLGKDPSLGPSELGVTSHEGIVTLTGYVPSYAEKLTAARVAQRVPGVEAVANDIQVRLPAEDWPTDAEIARAVWDALQRAALVPDNRIKVSVSGGWVYLEGECDRQSLKAEAADAVRAVAGVHGLTNQIVVDPPTALPGATPHIEAAPRGSELAVKTIRTDQPSCEVMKSDSLC